MRSALTERAGGRMRGSYCCKQRAGWERGRRERVPVCRWVCVYMHATRPNVCVHVHSTPLCVCALTPGAFFPLCLLTLRRALSLSGPRFTSPALFPSFPYLYFTPLFFLPLQHSFLLSLPLSFLCFGSSLLWCRINELPGKPRRWTDKVSWIQGTLRVWTEGLGGEWGREWTVFIYINRNSLFSSLFFVSVLDLFSRCLFPSVLCCCGSVVLPVVSPWPRYGAFTPIRFWVTPVPTP